MQALASATCSRGGIYCIFSVTQLVFFFVSLQTRPPQNACAFPPDARNVEPGGRLCCAPGRRDCGKGRERGGLCDLAQFGNVFGKFEVLRMFLGFVPGFGPFFFVSSKQYSLFCFLAGWVLRFFLVCLCTSGSFPSNSNSYGVVAAYLVGEVPELFQIPEVPGTAGEELVYLPVFVVFVLKTCSPDG